MSHFVLAFITALLALGQEPDSTLECKLVQAVEYERQYEFEKALDVYEQARESIPDTVVSETIDKGILRCENAISLSELCAKPRTLALRRFPKSEFFLFYPLKDGGWHELVWADSVSRPACHIYLEEVPDTLRLAGADSLEIFPIIVGDRKYFSAKDLYGVGGYDLYCSEWSAREQRWGEPTNLGFPFSSPGNDFLFVTTPDGRYNLFASDRECSPDSVIVYVLEHEDVPVSSAVEQGEELRKLCALAPCADLMLLDNSFVMSGSKPDDEPTEKYYTKLRELRQIRERISDLNRELDEVREDYASADFDEQQKLSRRILELEAELPLLGDALKKTGAELQDIEMEFLLNGVAIDPGKVAAEASKEVVGADQSYTFTKQSPGEPVIATYSK